MAAGVVLTGGASRRMGADKAALRLGAQTLASRTAGLLAACTDPVVELGPGWSGVRAIADAAHGSPPGGGPLAALAGGGSLWAALPDDGAVVVVATDMPRLTGGLLGWLAAHPATTPVVPVDADGRPQWLCARYPVAALRHLSAAPPTGRGVGAWARGLGPLLVEPAGWLAAAGDPLALADADTPDDLGRLAGSDPG